MYLHKGRGECKQQRSTSDDSGIHSEIQRNNTELDIFRSCYCQKYQQSRCGSEVCIANEAKPARDKSLKKSRLNAIPLEIHQDTQ
jgi:hypothetical protein